ncbi:FKBP-type peptidyl-prolyl cis-trans isomerase [Actinoplanes awajinensis]|uniref:Peptidyl-prolyl cis-trans isomerase n=1 Tax=Actinoplanes awajinensis subsp. mycoplanecinus TaxID=135947 RepID=A0A101JIK2_9ACTN|nr:FKBP-type peptidyl-prolyl cis-trans isomerase [Actinoplanes awajinensis]KUL27422.1 trigger factor [Actinoplanes awajinensis subsp. mycoplanecinus]
MSDQSAAASKRRSQAIMGGVAGALVFVVLAIVFFVVRSGDDDKQPTATNAAATQEALPPSAPVVTEPATSAPAAATGTDGLSPELQKEPDVKAGTGGPLTKLVITELVKGTGPVVSSGQTVTFNYKLIPFTGGAVIDSSWSRNEPFTSVIGAGQLIKGWDQGIPGQKVGSRIQMDVPSALAYGKGDLRFVVDILAAQ